MGLLTYLGLRRRNQWEPLTLIDHFLSSPLTFLVIQFYHFILFLRGRPFRPPRDKPPIRVVCISDTHDLKVPIPHGDILIHAGDLTNAGTVQDIDAQLNWLRKQPHPVKVVVAGNHDSWFDPASRPEKDVQSGAKPDLTGIHYLEGSMTVQEIKGRTIHIFGAPDIPNIGPKAFAFQYTDATQPWLSKIPIETDILVTHTPPLHHRDLSLGCRHLLREIWRVKPRLHVFGHVHWGYGQESVFWDELQEAYEHFLSRPRRGPVWDFFPNDAWIDVLRILVYGVHSVLWKWLMSGPGSNKGGLMVNAGQMYGNSGKVKSRAVVIDI
ncbi:Metallo-dependent phosphatase-like protein [Thelonectria olida]|uniref:Metallo-dependent phosphatase-like protein n=1 Tax=Thelonectria olida TaxID=1576542 RepID=A0A9P8WEY0_9HYPO|nr:Metallo-dependent phosphatase-like protein [Thelonectria olida]